MAYADGRFWAVPSRQIFSRHLGVCLILGDKSVRGGKHKLQVKPDQHDIKPTRTIYPSHLYQSI